MRAALVAWIGLVACGASGCLLFTDTVNTPPVVQIEGADRLHRGEKGDFAAQVTDATPGERRFVWRSGTTCPADLAAAELGDHVGTTAMVTAHQDDPETYCVWVIVTDAEGARGFASKPVEVFDRTLVLSGPVEVQSGQPATFTAQYQNDPPAAPRSSFSWALTRDLRCEDAALAARVAEPELGLVSFRYERAQRAPFCVAVLARDEFGIERPATLPVTGVRIAAPPAAIRLVGRGAAAVTMDSSFGIFSDIRLAAADEGELDPTESLRFDWKLTGPDGAALTASACPDARPPGSEIRFQPERRGSYHVDLTVSDADDRRTTAPRFDLKVEDRAPCIRNSEPRFSSARKFFDFYDRERVLKVTEVEDDGDPWPSPGRATQRAFRWSIRKHGDPTAGFQRRVSAIFDSFTIPAREYQPRDQIDVRIEYFDRRDLEDPQARGVTTRCRADDPVCELVPGSGCYQWITWTVEYL